jgi:DNA-binding response OmpR family regulator
MRVLVVDDDPRVHALVKSVCKKRGYEVVSAEDGQEGLVCAETRQPDLIIVDVMMPRIDGWSLVSRLRTRARLATVPIIFLTALSSDEDRLHGFRLGADAYITKPFRLDELGARIDSALRGRKDLAVARKKLAALTTPPAGVRPPVIDGALEDFGLAILFFILEQENKTGVLRLSRTDAAGEIVYDKGRIVAARLGGRKVPASARMNEGAIYHMLGWSQGWFAFSAEKVEGEAEMKASANELLLEGARLLDESRRSG